MHYFIFPKKDTTIYEDSINQNTGIDQILELTKTLVHEQDDSPVNSRILIQFDISDFSSSYSNKELSGSDMKYYLNLYTSEAIEIPTSYSIFIYPISQSWEMGTGKRSDNPITTLGTSWNLRDGITVSGVTGSAWNITGSDFLSGSSYTQYECSQSYDFQTTDLHVDITNIVNGWLTNQIPNYGLIIKRNEPDEQSILNHGSLLFYSNESSTIYRPKLEIIWKEYSNNPNTSTSVSYSYSEITQSYNISDYPITHYLTSSFYSGGGINLQTNYFTKSQDISYWYSESYYNYTQSIWSWTSSYALYHSSSFETSSTYNYYNYYSGSNLFISKSIINTNVIVYDSYTASLGSEYISGNTNISYSLGIPGLTASSIWNFSQTTGVYFSQSFTSVLANYTYISSSIIGYSTASSSTITQLMYEVPGEDFIVFMTNRFDEYRQNSRVRFRLKARQRFPARTFVTESWDYTTTDYYLPTSSYYAIKDIWSEDEIIPFSSYSQISIDSSGSFFDLYLNGLEPERIYRILIKTIKNSIETIHDKNYTFRIIR